MFVYQGVQSKDGKITFFGNPMKIRHEFVSFQETFKVTVINFDTIVDTGEGRNRIMGHFTSIECNQSAQSTERVMQQVKAKALDIKYALIKIVDIWGDQNLIQATTQCCALIKILL